MSLLGETPGSVSETLSTAIETVLDQVPFGRWLGLQLTAVEDDRVLMQLGMREEFVGNPARNILHGGVISSVLDTVGGASPPFSAFSPKHRRQATGPRPRPG